MENGLQNGLKCILRDIDFKKYPGVVPKTPFNKRGGSIQYPSTAPFKPSARPPTPGKSQFKN